MLDVAGGTGNAAIAAARGNCHVTCTDYVPALLNRGRERARAEGLAIEFEPADAEALPYDDGSFDAVLSVFGAMFAPNQPQAAAELARVCRPGGLIGLASWTPAGFLGEVFRAHSAIVPPPPGVASPLRWGTEDGIGELLGAELESIQTRRRTFTWRFADAAAFVPTLRDWYGPTLKAFEAAGPEREAELERALLAVAERSARARGRAIAIPAEYLEVVAVRLGGPRCGGPTNGSPRDVSLAEQNTSVLSAHRVQSVSSSSVERLAPSTMCASRSPRASMQVPQRPTCARRTSGLSMRSRW